MNHQPQRILRKKIYVKVNVSFDSTGYMQPASIIWDEHKILPIEKIKDYSPAGASDNKLTDCFTVVIQGQDKHLFFERTDPRFESLVGRWFVEKVELNQ